MGLVSAGLAAASAIGNAIANERGFKFINGKYYIFSYNNLIHTPYWDLISEYLLNRLE